MSHLAIAQLLQNDPLYRRIEIDKIFYHPWRLNDLPFQFYCKKDGGERTFKLTLEPAQAIKAVSSLEFNKAFNSFKSDTEIEFVHFYTGTCQTCETEKVHFLLHVFSEGELNRGIVEPNALHSINRGEQANGRDNGKLFIRKVGQWPCFQLKPDAMLYNFLDKEDKDYYYKALMCLSQSYGVAAFAYLRKIVERELIRLMEELTKSSSGNTEAIKNLLSEYRGKKQTSQLVENIYQFLPNNLKVLNDNPIKLLYGYLSESLQHHNDEECLKYAIAIDKLLQFTIKRLREDQTEIRDVREAIKNIPSIS